MAANTALLSSVAAVMNAIYKHDREDTVLQLLVKQ